MTKLPLHTGTAGGGGRKQERVLVGKDRELRFFFPNGPTGTGAQVLLKRHLEGFFPQCTGVRLPMTGDNMLQCVLLCG
jgi:hypothetical protein